MLEYCLIFLAFLKDIADGTCKTLSMTKQFQIGSGEEFQGKSHFRGRCLEILNNLKNEELKRAKIEYG